MSRQITNRTMRTTSRKRHLVLNDDGQCINISSEPAHVNDVNHLVLNVINGRGPDNFVPDPVTQAQTPECCVTSLSRLAMLRRRLIAAR